MEIIAGEIVINDVRKKYCLIKKYAPLNNEELIDIGIGPHKI